MLPAYAELHCISNFTFLRGASHPEELVAQAAALGYAALAITDECSLSGIVRAHVRAKALGLKLLVGSEIRLADGTRLVILARDRVGYAALCALLTRGRRNAGKGSYRLTRDDLADGLSGCLFLLLEDIDAAILAERADWLRQLAPGRAWLAVALLLADDDQAHLARLREVGRLAGLPLVAAGDVHMHVRSRRALQDTLAAIRLNQPLSRLGCRLLPNGERHLRSREALARIYPAELLAETLHVAQQCEFSLDSLRYEYPRELVPVGETPTSWLRQLTERGIATRWPEGIDSRLRRQIEHELVLIAELQYEPFFLTVHDIVRFARSRDILCQGRGSAANSAVCYCLGITEVDPARMEMLIERFISKERNEPPDIDVDFEHHRREEVIQYVYDKYSRDRAALAATLITYRPKSAIRDVGKALGLSLEQVDKLASTMHWWDGKRVVPERLHEAGLDPKTPVARRLLRLVAEIMGFPRHLSQHVGGFVIARDKLANLVPVENAAMPGRTVIQWDKDDLEALGLLKVDCLCLGMLTAIHNSFQLIAGFRGGSFCMDDVPAEDPATYRMIQHADTVGVFQIESRAQMAMLPRLKPASYYDLVIEVAIIRPGPIQGEMVHPYLRRREGKEAVTYPSPEVREVLERTLGVPLFQEQVIKLAMVAAGFTGGEADHLRRSMAAWKRNGGMEPFRQRLVDGMLERGYSAEFAERIFKQIQGFADYGFPESHAASFALLAYVSAWLKCREPAAYLAGLLNAQPMGFYAPAQLVTDARRHGIEVRPVDVTRGSWDCSLEPATVATESLEGAPAVDLASFIEPLQPQPAVRLGLRIVKGLSQEAASRIVTARDEAPFADASDLKWRALLNAGDMEALAAAGALSGLAGNRHRARWEVAGVEAALPVLPTPRVAEAEPMLRSPTEGEDIVADYASVGLTLGRHPLALLREQLVEDGFITARELAQRAHGSEAYTLGIVINRQRPGTATGVVFATLEDETGSINLIVWSSLVEPYRRELLGASLLGVRGEVQREGEVIHLVARHLEDHSRLLGRLTTRSRDFH